MSSNALPFCNFFLRSSAQDTYLNIDEFILQNSPCQTCPYKVTA
jgi:hypothetical protein